MELVTVLLLLGVLAIAVAPRFYSTGIAEQTYQARLISALRYMQQRAMQDSRAFYCYQINLQEGANSQFGPRTLNYSGNPLATCLPGIGSEDDANFLRTEPGEMAEDNVELVLAKDSGGVNNAFDPYVRFTSKGCTTQDGLACSLRQRIEVRGVTSSRFVCIEPNGYIHACD